MKGERRKLKDRTMIHLHSNQPSDIDGRTQRRKIEDHVHGQWVKEEKVKEEKNRNRRLRFLSCYPKHADLTGRISGMARILSDVL